MTDSSGIRIVQNGTPGSAEWTANSEPLFSLGWAAGDPTFTWVQSGQIMPDGGALIGEYGEGKIYRLAPDGTVLEVWGRKGEGPGEYQGLDALILQGDSVIVTDGRLRRITVLSREGEVVATEPLPGSFLHYASSAFADGRVLLVPGDGYSGVSEMRPEWVFEMQPILITDLVEAETDTLAELPHLRRWYGTRGAGPGPISVKGRAGGFADGFAWARSDRPEVTWYDSSGRLLQVAHWEEQPFPLTPDWEQDMAQAYREAYAARGAEEAFINAEIARLEEGLDRHDGPLPYWDGFHVDRVGNVWLGQYGLPIQPPDRWRVITRDGTLQGWVELPGYVTLCSTSRIRTSWLFASMSSTCRRWSCWN
ncbi:MAG: hypothetical protein U5R14_01935 [Gemmatimonadota bacterium]|nr:hypothetical protein [Gemmatimonadota bacterium]